MLVRPLKNYFKLPDISSKDDIEATLTSFKAEVAKKFKEDTKNLKKEERNLYNFIADEEKKKQGKKRRRAEDDDDKTPDEDVDDEDDADEKDQMQMDEDDDYEDDDSETDAEDYPPIVNPKITKKKDGREEICKDCWGKTKKGSDCKLRACRGKYCRFHLDQDKHQRSDDGGINFKFAPRKDKSLGILAARDIEKGDKIGVYEGILFSLDKRKSEASNALGIPNLFRGDHFDYYTNEKRFTKKTKGNRKTKWQSTRERKFWPGLVNNGYLRMDISSSLWPSSYYKHSQQQRKYNAKFKSVVNDFPHIIATKKIRKNQEIVIKGSNRYIRKRKMPDLDAFLQTGQINDKLAKLIHSARQQ